MNRRSWLGVLPKALALASLPLVALAAAAPQGYFVDLNQASARRPTSVERTDGDFTMSIHREYKDSIGARLWAWRYDDGIFTPGTRAHPIVLLTPAGKVLRVEGDGGADEDVSMSNHRRAGRDRRTR